MTWPARIPRNALVSAGLIWIGIVVCATAEDTAPALLPALQARPQRPPLGSAMEMKYSWTTGPGFTKPAPGSRALVHFLDTHGLVLFTDDHTPTPAPDKWLPGKTYTYDRTFFVPVYPYVGQVHVVMGLSASGDHPQPGGLKAGDRGPLMHTVATLEVLPQVDNIFLVYKEGWHTPESAPENPALELAWTKKDAVVAFKNPKKDIVIYLEADTDSKAFARPPVLTLTIGTTTVATIPVKTKAVFLKKIQVKAANLGGEEWVDLHLVMNGSFTRTVRGEGERELGLRVRHLYVGEASRFESTR